MNPTKRRTFLQAAGVGLAGVMVRAGRTAPSERVRHAVIGTGGQGKTHCRQFAAQDICEVVAVCDVDPNRRAEAAAMLPNPAAAKQVEDYRRVLEDKGIDSVSIATPDHWHAKIAIEALMAGKHVYVEKPCCHNIREGQRLVETAERTGKCVQHGTQSRSGEGIRKAIQFLQEGGLGRVRMAKAINHQLRKPIGHAPVGTPPEGAAYDLWLGPAPLHAFTQNRWHYNWHWFWDYGTGDIGNDGIHQIDVARWGLGVALPQAVSASGGQLFYEDDHETPDTQVAVFEYEKAYLMYEMRLWTDYPLEGHDNGTVFFADEGRLDIGRQGCVVTRIGKEPEHLGGGVDLAAHVRNFLECVRANDPAQLHAPIREGFYSASLSHLGNIATRVKRRLRFDPEAVRVDGDEEANRLLGREYRKGYGLAEE